MAHPGGRYGAAPLVALSLLVAAPSLAQEFSDEAVAKMSIEELLSTEITSARRHAQPLAQVSSAVYVLSGEEIRKSGAHSIADALRLVPGVQVGAIDANRRAVGVRGFNTLWSRQLLVMIDGRSIYTATFSGVYWERVDLLFEDIDRIEVIRGPGASVWGANAVNGVINIITKSAAASHERLAQVGGGSEERALGALRLGGASGHSAWRVSGKWIDRAASGHPLQSSLRDQGTLGSFTGRLDTSRPGGGSLMLQGGIQRGQLHYGVAFSQITEPYQYDQTVNSRIETGFGLAHWTAPLGNSLSYDVQAFVDLAQHEQVHDAMKTRVYDLEAQSRWHPDQAIDVVAGVGVRHAWHRVTHTQWISATPAARGSYKSSGFVQLEWEPLGSCLNLTGGSKFEWNDQGGLETLPTVRALWTPAAKHAVWAAVSRAVHTPSVFEQDGYTAIYAAGPGTALNPGTIPVLVTYQGSSEFNNETAVAYEAGYRVQPHASCSVDLAAFKMNYDDLFVGSLGQPTLRLGAVPHVVIPITVRNDAPGDTRGIELAVDWAPRPNLRVRSGYSVLRMNLPAAVEGGTDVPFPGITDFAPRQQFFSHLSCGSLRRLALDSVIRVNDAKGRPGIRSYTQLDLRAAHRFAQRLDVAVVGENLLKAEQIETLTEFDDIVTQRQRGYYTTVTFNF